MGHHGCPDRPEPRPQKAGDTRGDQKQAVTMPLVLFVFTSCLAARLDEHRTPASPDDPSQAIAHALQFEGRKQLKVSGEMMAKITAVHLVECLPQAE